MKIAADGQTVQSGERRFELIGGHPLLDLVNTLDWRFRLAGPEELLGTYRDLLRFTEQAGMIGAAQARRILRATTEIKAGLILSAVRDLREAASEVLYASVDQKHPLSSAVGRLEGHFHEAEAHLELRWNGSKLWRDLQSSTLSALPLWKLSLSAAAFMTSDEMDMVRACVNPECRWLFVDCSKNHSRRWCDMKICGNRMKARRFKAHHRE